VSTLAAYVEETCDQYCAGCANICEAAAPDMPHISDVMRYMMYYNNYHHGHQQRARDLFARIPEQARRRMTSVDYAAAEAACPQRLPIGRIMSEAADTLA